MAERIKTNDGFILSFVFFRIQNRRQRSSGFTLIELIVMMTIVSILAATAVPRYMDLRDEAAQAAANGVAGAMESGASLNHALDLAVEANLTTITTDPFYNITNCTHGVFLLDPAVLPDGYAIASSPIGDKETESCTLTGLAGSTANFLMIGAADGVNP